MRCDDLLMNVLRIWIQESRPPKRFEFMKCCAPHRGIQDCFSGTGSWNVRFENCYNVETGIEIFMRRDYLGRFVDDLLESRPLGVFTLVF